MEYLQEIQDMKKVMISTSNFGVVLKATENLFKCSLPMHWKKKIRKILLM